MYFGEPDTKRQKYIIGGITAFLILLFILAFPREVGDLLKLVLAFLRFFISLRFELPADFSPQSLLILLYNLIFGFILVFLIWLVLISQQALLPVRPFNFYEVLRTAWHLFIFILGRHGPAIFVKDGEQISTQEDITREGPGVVVVDFNSAVVLETRISALGLSRPYSRLLLDISRLLGLSDKPESPRVRGPGIVFTLPRERIRGVVDLRKQFRIQPSVLCYTREGIELYANVHATFTIGQDPDVLQVTYEGEPNVQNLRVLTLEKVPGGHVRLVGISDMDLDAADANEIHQFHRVIQRTHEWFDFSWPPPPSQLPVYNRDRVFSAVFAQALNGNQEVLLWSDLPTRVAADFYREILSQVNYDDLYGIREQGNFPLPTYKRKLMLRMRNNGILSYRMVFHREGHRLERGHVYREADLVVSDVHPLRNPKVLRDRGIKIIASGFGDLNPVSQAVYQQRLDTWRASWDHDLELRQAERDLEAMQIRSRAYAQAMRDLSYSLSMLMQNCDFTDEAIALRILQALEKAATDPKTNQLLPANSIDLLRTVAGMLQPTLADQGPPPGMGSLPQKRF